MDLDTYLILKNFKITSSYGMINIKINKYILFKFNIQFQHMISVIRTLKGNKIMIFYSNKFSKTKKKVIYCFSFFSSGICLFYDIL